MAIASALIDLSPLMASPVFRRLWIGRTFSGFGAQMTIVAVMFQVWQLTRSPIWTGAVGIAQAVPMVVVGLIGGGLADRTDRRRLVLRTTVGQFSVSILLTLQGFLGHLPVLGVLALVSLQTGFVAVGGPAGRTFTPRLLPKQQVSAGLALTRIGFQAAILVGPAVAGLLLGWVGVGGCYPWMPSASGHPSTACSGSRRCDRRGKSAGPAFTASPTGYGSSPPRQPSGAL